jgi:sarcosine oxidase, subunit gamma
MVESYQRRSALAHFGLLARAASGGKPVGGVTMAEVGHRTIINIRGTASDPAFASAVQAATGVTLPSAANTVSSGGGRQILWLGPNEWWVTGADGEADALVEKLRENFMGQHATACDVSESRAILVLKGPRAREVLMRGVSLDLHPREFHVDQCAQTGLSRANVLLHLIDDAPTFEIYVLKSFSDYLWRWLEKVAQDFDLAVEA